ncbi:MAG: alpha/beta hydrolase [Chloroflexi bacterium]|nr:alpha/beta hydrolase [Chloroflexota bacterium]
MNEVKTKSGVLENVNYVQQGEGAPVILTHGLAASLHDWDDLLPVMAASGYAGYALDLLGHGESYKPADHHEFTFEAVFEHFSAWVDSLQINEPMILVGHSLGGGIVLQYALQYPERVRALVVVNPFYDIRQLSSAMRFIYRNKLLNTNLLGLAPYRLFRIFVDLTSTNFYAGHREPHVLPERIRHQTAEDFARASSGIYNIPYTLPYLTLDMRRINQPTLLIWGSRDQTLAPESFPRIETLLPNIVSSHSMPVCGHVPHQCHPENFNPLVMKFLSDL